MSRNIASLHELMKTTSAATSDGTNARPAFADFRKG